MATLQKTTTNITPNIITNTQPNNKKQAEQDATNKILVNVCYVFSGKIFL